MLNILGVLSSMMRTAKSWGYNVQPIVTSDLALPAAQVRKQPRFFNGEEARRIIMIAAEPYRTMFAIAAMTGLRVIGRSAAAPPLYRIPSAPQHYKTWQSAPHLTFRLFRPGAPVRHHSPQAGQWRIRQRLSS